jgi:hypothetical protein
MSIVFEFEFKHLDSSFFSDILDRPLADSKRLPRKIHFLCAVLKRPKDEAGNLLLLIVVCADTSSGGDSANVTPGHGIYNNT